MNLRRSHLRTKALQIIAALACAAVPTHAQQLARPGWQDNGNAVEPWWRHTVYARISVPCSAEPCDGVTPLVHRTNSLRALGIDSLILPLRTIPAGGEATDDLVSRSIRGGLHLVIDLNDGAPLANDVLLAQARLWMNRGASGFVLHADSLDATQAASLQTQLLALEASAPGERILLITGSAAASAAGTSHRTQTASHVSGKKTGRVSAAMLPVANLPQPLTAAALTALFAGGAAPLLAQTAAAKPEAEPATAAVLLLTRSTPLLNLPLDRIPEDFVPESPPEPETPKPAPPKPAYDPNQYGEFHPYVPPPPPPKPTGPVAPPPEPREHEWLRRLATELRSQPTFHAGEQQFLPHDGEGALAWVRTPPANRGAVAAKPVFVLCNLTDQPIHFSLADDVKRLRLKGYFLRALIRSDDSMGSQPLENVTLAPHAVFVGELSR